MTRTCAAPGPGPEELPGVVELGDKCVLRTDDCQLILGGSRVKVDRAAEGAAGVDAAVVCHSHRLGNVTVRATPMPGPIPGSGSFQFHEECIVGSVAAERVEPRSWIKVHRALETTGDQYTAVDRHGHIVASIIACAAQSLRPHEVSGRTQACDKDVGIAGTGAAERVDGGAWIEVGGPLEIAGHHYVAAGRDRHRLTIARRSTQGGGPSGNCRRHPASTRRYRESRRP